MPVNGRLRRSLFAVGDLAVDQPVDQLAQCSPRAASDTTLPSRFIKNTAGMPEMPYWSAIGLSKPVSMRLGVDENFFQGRFLLFDELGEIVPAFVETHADDFEPRLWYLS